MQENENKSGAIKWIIIVIAMILIILLGIILLMTVGKDTGVAKSIGNAFPFGALSPEAPRDGFTETNGDGSGDGDASGVDTLTEPLFRQLTNEQIAGATTVERDGKTYIRYVLRENGYVYEIDTTTWKTRELTNTQVPRVYEAYFGNNGNTVILRYIKLDPLTRQDVIKTFMAYLVLPTEDSGEIGKLTGSDLLDNISAVSISPDGTRLFFLRPLADGVSGSMVYLTSQEEPREVLRNSFSEWLPQLLDNGSIILTTKPSVNVPGYAYVYDPVKKTLTRLVREKNGLTTLSNKNGERILFNENIGNVATLGLYDRKGFSSEEGTTIHHQPVPLTTLPEKCVWGKSNSLYFYCGAFSVDSHNKIPDDWYQGTLKLKDNFWMINSTDAVIGYLADPQREVKMDFDVFMPFIGNEDTKFYFTDKKTGFLWVMRIIRPSVLTDDEPATTTTDTPTPEEAGDAAGILDN